MPTSVWEPNTRLRLEGPGSGPAVGFGGRGRRNCRAQQGRKLSYQLEGLANELLRRLGGTESSSTDTAFPLSRHQGESHTSWSTLRLGASGHTRALTPRDDSFGAGKGDVTWKVLSRAETQWKKQGAVLPTKPCPRPGPQASPPHQQRRGQLTGTASPAGTRSCQHAHFPWAADPATSVCASRPLLAPPGASTAPSSAWDTPTQPARSNVSPSEGFLQISHSSLCAPAVLEHTATGELLVCASPFLSLWPQRFHGKQTWRHERFCTDGVAGQHPAPTEPSARGGSALWEGPELERL